MTPSSIGQTWAPRTGVCPAIHSLAEIRDQLPQSLIRISVQQWVIDYEFQPFGRIRCGSAQAPWRARPPFVLHLYAPETVIWEDTQGPPGPRHSAWILFTGGDPASLLAFLPLGREADRISHVEGALLAIPAAFNWIYYGMPMK